MIKKFSDFQNDISERVEMCQECGEELNNCSCPEECGECGKVECVCNIETNVEETISENVKEPIVEEPKINESKIFLDKVIFNGKIAKIPSDIKISEAIKILEESKIDKNKLHYLLSEDKEFLVLVKYNNKAAKNLNDFAASLLKHYESKELNVKNISIKGASEFVIIKNIPNDIKIGEDLYKLLKF